MVLPIIHGSFQQKSFSIYGKNLDIILLARRSRHYAGTRYLKRGLNVHGKVANDVEVEQIIQLGTGVHCQYSSYVQMRGSIPTYWYQETSVTNPKPPILIDRLDAKYLATQEHFSDLMVRYGTPIIVLDLVKQQERKKRESVIGAEFKEAVDVLNRSIPSLEKQIRYCAMDFSRISKAKKDAHMEQHNGSSSSSRKKVPDATGKTAMSVVGNEWETLEKSYSNKPKVAGGSGTGGTSSNVKPSGGSARERSRTIVATPGGRERGQGSTGNREGKDRIDRMDSLENDPTVATDALEKSTAAGRLDVLRELDDLASYSMVETSLFCSTTAFSQMVQFDEADRTDMEAKGYIKQHGVLRTNCIDCLDRTNVAQFAMGVRFLTDALKLLGVLQHNSLSLGGLEADKRSLESVHNVLKAYMDMFSVMGDRISLQYGGSEAHNKMKQGGAVSGASTSVVSSSTATGGKSKGPNKGAELLTSVKRYYSNSFTDRLKQDAMNLFLGCFIPFQQPPDVSLWDLESDYFLHNLQLRPTQPLSNQILFRMVNGVVSDSILQMIVRRCNAFQIEDDDSGDGASSGDNGVVAFEVVLSTSQNDDASSDRSSSCSDAETSKNEHVTVFPVQLGALTHYFLNQQFVSPSTINFIDTHPYFNAVSTLSPENASTKGSSRHGNDTLSDVEHLEVIEVNSFSSEHRHKSKSWVKGLTRGFSKKNVSSSSNANKNKSTIIDKSVDISDLIGVVSSLPDDVKYSIARSEHRKQLLMKVSKYIQHADSYWWKIALRQHDELFGYPGEFVGVDDMGKRRNKNHIDTYKNTSDYYTRTYNPQTLVSFDALFNDADDHILEVSGDVDVMETREDAVHVSGTLVNSGNPERTEHRNNRQENENCTNVGSATGTAAPGYGSYFIDLGSKAMGTLLTGSASRDSAAAHTDDDVCPCTPDNPNQPQSQGDCRAHPLLGHLDNDVVSPDMFHIVCNSPGHSRSLNDSSRMYESNNVFGTNTDPVYEAYAAQADDPTVLFGLDLMNIPATAAPSSTMPATSKLKNSKVAISGASSSSGSKSREKGKMATSEYAQLYKHIYLEGADLVGLENLSKEQNINVVVKPYGGASEGGSTLMASNALFKGMKQFQSANHGFALLIAAMNNVDMDLLSCVEYNTYKNAYHCSSSTMATSSVEQIERLFEPEDADSYLHGHEPNRGLTQIDSDDDCDGFMPNGHRLRGVSNVGLRGSSTIDHENATIPVTSGLIQTAPTSPIYAIPAFKSKRSGGSGSGKAVGRVVSNNSLIDVPDRIKKKLQKFHRFHKSMILPNNNPIHPGSYSHRSNSAKDSTRDSMPSMGQDLTQHALRAIFQQTFYANELSMEKLSRRLSSYTSDRVISQYMCAFDSATQAYDLDMTSYLRLDRDAANQFSAFTALNELDMRLQHLLKMHCQWEEVKSYIYSTPDLYAEYVELFHRRVKALENAYYTQKQANILAKQRDIVKERESVVKDWGINLKVGNKKKSSVEYDVVGEKKEKDKVAALLESIRSTFRNQSNFNSTSTSSPPGTANKGKKYEHGSGLKCEMLSIDRYDSDEDWDEANDQFNPHIIAPNLEPKTSTVCNTVDYSGFITVSYDHYVKQENPYLCVNESTAHGAHKYGKLGAVST